MQTPSPHVQGFRLLLCHHGRRGRWWQQWGGGWGVGVGASVSSTPSWPAATNTLGHRLTHSPFTQHTLTRNTPHPLHTHTRSECRLQASFSVTPPDGWLAGAVSSCGRSGHGGSCGSSRHGLSGDGPGAGSCDRWARWTGLEGSAPGGKASAHLLKTGTALLANENSRCLSGWDVPLKAVLLPRW